jgi:hypothetical protein
MTTTKAKVGKVEARAACVITVGARPVTYRKVIVRDRHTHQLVEVELHEAEPLDFGDPGRSYAFSRGQKEWSDHEAVLDAPGCFQPIDE